MVRNWKERWINNQTDNRERGFLKKGNTIGVEGSRMVSLAMKVNTTMKVLDLSGLLWLFPMDLVEMNVAYHNWETGNVIGNQGALQVCEMLKANTSLQSIDLRCLKNKYRVCLWYLFSMFDREWNRRWGSKGFFRSVEKEYNSRRT